MKQETFKNETNVTPVTKATNVIEVSTMVIETETLATPVTKATNVTEVSTMAIETLTPVTTATEVSTMAIETLAPATKGNKASIATKSNKISIATKLKTAVSIMAIFLVATFFTSAALASEISVFVEEQQVVFPDQEPVAEDGHRLIPIHAVFSALGYNVDWDESTRIASLVSTNSIFLTIDNPVAQVNNSNTTLLVAPRLIGNRTMLPVEELLEYLGYHSKWEQDVLFVSTEPLSKDGVVEPVAVGDIIEDTTDEVTEVVDAIASAETDEVTDEVTVVEVLRELPIISGYGRHFVIDEDNNLWGFGTNNQSGSIGNGTTSSVETPALILENVASVHIGPYNSAAITLDGSLWMWGDNQSGQIGDGTKTILDNNFNIVENNDRLSPVQVEGLYGVVYVSLTEMHTVALTEDGYLFGFGENQLGQLGNGSSEPELMPVIIVDNVAAVATFGNRTMNSATAFTLVLDTTGTLWSFGGYRYYEWLEETESEELVTNYQPIPVVVLRNVSAIYATATEGLAITTNNVLYSVFGEDTIRVLDNVVSVTDDGLILRGDNTLWDFMLSADFDEDGLMIPGSQEAEEFLLNEDVIQATRNLALRPDGNLYGYVWSWELEENITHHVLDDVSFIHGVLAVTTAGHLYYIEWADLENGAFSAVRMLDNVRV